METHEIDYYKAGRVIKEEVEELLHYIIVNKACYRMDRNGDPYVFLGPVPREIGLKLKEAFGGFYRSTDMLHPLPDNFYRVYGSEAADLIRLLLPKLMRKDPYRYSFAVVLV